MTDDRRDDAERLARIDESRAWLRDGPLQPPDQWRERASLLLNEIDQRDATIAAKDAEIARWRDRYNASVEMGIEEQKAKETTLAEIADLNAELREHEANALKQDAEIAGLKEQLGIAEWIATITDEGKEIAALRAENERLRATINTPETRDFINGVKLESAHQRERWGNDHDAGKAPSDWYWLIGYLAGKALQSHMNGDLNKAKHHTISTAAALCNWHAAILGKTNMRPGIELPSCEALAPPQEPQG